MLDAYIIDAIRNEELERERAFERRRIWLELPLPTRDPREQQRDRRHQDENDGSDPVVIPFSPEIGIIRREDREEDAA